MWWIDCAIKLKLNRCMSDTLDILDKGTFGTNEIKVAWCKVGEEIQVLYMYLFFFEKTMYLFFDNKQPRI